MAVYFGQEKGLGDILGVGLGKGLGQLIQQKMQKMQTAKGLAGAGFSADRAGALANLSPQMASMIIPQEMKGIQRQKEFGILKQLFPSSGDGLTSDDGSSTNAAANKAVMQAFVSGGNAFQASRAGQKAKANADKLAQKRTENEERKEAEALKIKEGRITTGLTDARKEAKESISRIESYRESAKNYKNIRLLTKVGKPVTGVSAAVLQHFGIDSSVTGWDTQLMKKAFAAEPVRALRYIPGQAVRLSKVFDTLKDMHGSLINTPEGIDAIARTKIVEAKAAKAIEKEYVKSLEKYRKKEKGFPLDLREKATKAVSKKLNKYGAEIQYIISDSIVKGGIKLSDYKVGERIISDDGSKRVFIKKNVFGRPTWVVKD